MSKFVSNKNNNNKSNKVILKTASAMLARGQKDIYMVSKSTHFLKCMKIQNYFIISLAHCFYFEIFQCEKDRGSTGAWEKNRVRGLAKNLETFLSEFLDDQASHLFYNW